VLAATRALKSILKNSLDHNHSQTATLPLPPSHDNIRALSTSSKKESAHVATPMKEKLYASSFRGWSRRWNIKKRMKRRRELGFLDRLALLIDQQWNWRQNQALNRRVLALATGTACVEKSIIVPSED